jgi:demethylmenaquinone methyltransferase/2-methoxy-6-polyprenyl-1,4-benzoquinol methylase
VPSQTFGRAAADDGVDDGVDDWVDDWADDWVSAVVLTAISLFRPAWSSARTGPIGPRPVRQTPAVTRADLDKEPLDVARMFDDVAERYDLTNDVLSLGQDRRWRRAVVDAVAGQAGDRVLDLAAGTGTSSVPFAEQGCFVVACDFSLGMLAAGQRRRPELAFVAGDATRLPFADEAFDAVTISFGLRNVHDPDAALAEMLRVTRPGGRLVICEFSHPTWAPFRQVYREYLMRALPAVARAVSSNPDAYVYLAESIRQWPTQRELAAQLQRTGWVDVAWRDLSGGIVALHRGTRPT